MSIDTTKYGSKTKGQLINELVMLQEEIAKSKQIPITPADDLMTSHHEFSLKLLGTHGFVETLKVCLEYAIFISDMDSGGIYILNDSTGDLELIVDKGMSTDFVEKISFVKAGSERANLVMVGKPIFVKHLNLPVPKEEVLLAEELRALAVIPIKHNDKVIACLNLASHEIDEVPEYSRKNLESLTVHIEKAIFRARLDKSLKEANTQLINEKSKLNTILETMESGVTIRDPDYNLLYHNNLVTNLWGDCVGKKCYEVFDGRDNVCDNCPVELAFKDGKSHTYIKEVSLPTGGIKFFENVATPIRDAKGNIVSCLEINTDITERRKDEEALRESQERLSSFMDSATDGFGIFDSDLNLIDVNDAVTKFAFFKKEDMIGKHLLDIIPPIKTSGRYKTYLQVLKTGKPAFFDNILPGVGWKKGLHLNVRAFKVGDGLGMTLP